MISRPRQIVMHGAFPIVGEEANLEYEHLNRFGPN